MSITKQSSEALAKRLAAIAPEIKAKVAPAIVKGAEEVAKTARQLAEASRLSGDNIEEIEVVMPGETLEAGDQQKTLHELQAVVHAGAPHAHLIEFGTEERQHKDGHPTGQMEAQPFMIPSWRLNRARVERRINRAISAGIKDALK